MLGPLGETQVDVETDDGVVQIGAADVPDVVDDSFPIPSDLQVQISSQEGAVAGFSGVTELAFGDLVDFYESALPAAGYESELGRFVDGVVAVFDFSGPAGEGQVADLDRTWRRPQRPRDVHGALMDERSPARAGKRSMPSCVRISPMR